MKSLKTSILKTLSYSQVFSWPLKTQEVYQYLISNKKLSLSDVKKALTQLETQKKVFKYKKYWSLKNTKLQTKSRLKSEKISQKKLSLLKKKINLIKKIPGVLMVGVTGNVAVGNSQKNDDIDLIIITKKNRLWTTRLILTLLLDLIGWRRRPNDKNVKNKLCLNLFLDESDLKLKKSQQNLFTSHELVQIKPVLNRKHTYERFLSKNKWLNKYLPNYPLTILATPGVAKGEGSSEGLGSKINKILFKIQKKYMASKITRERVTLTQAFFHPRNTGSQILKKYRQNLLKLGIND